MTKKNLKEVKLEQLAEGSCVVIPFNPLHFKEHDIPNGHELTETDITYLKEYEQALLELGIDCFSSMFVESETSFDSTMPYLYKLKKPIALLKSARKEYIDLADELTDEVKDFSPIIWPWTKNSIHFRQKESYREFVNTLTNEEGEARQVLAKFIDVLDNEKTGKLLFRIQYNYDTSHSIVMHSLSVVEHGLKLGMALNLTQQELADLGLALMVHDIGMIPIYMKYGNIFNETKEGRAAVKFHPLLSKKILTEANNRPINGFNKSMIDAIAHHHNYSSKPDYERDTLSKILYLVERLNTDEKGIPQYDSEIEELVKSAIENINYDEAIDQNILEKFLQRVYQFPIDTRVGIAPRNNEDTIKFYGVVKELDDMNPQVHISYNPQHKKMVTPENGYLVDMGDPKYKEHFVLRLDTNSPINYGNGQLV